MEEEKLEEVSLNPEEGADTSKTDGDEDLEVLKKRAQLADDYKIRAEKAEKALKQVAKPEGRPAPEAGSLSTKDVLYLAKADIHEDDLEEVTKQAKLQGITVSEAHKFLKPILDSRAEERKTALATQTGRTQRGITKTTGEDLLSKAEATGEMPDDDEGMAKLAQARLNKKVKG